MKTVTGQQIRAARALLEWNAETLAEKSGVGLSTIRRAETGKARTIPANIGAIRAALEAGGIQFIAENGGGAGVRLRERVAE